MSHHENEVEEKTKDLQEPVKTLVAVCMRNTDCGDDEISLLKDPTLQLPLKYYLYACIVDKYPMNILKELSECKSNTALQKKRKAYEISSAASRYLQTVRQAAEEWQSRAEMILGRVEQLLPNEAEKAEQGKSPPFFSFSGFPGSQETIEGKEPPDSRKASEMQDAESEERQENDGEALPEENVAETGYWKKKALSLEEENRLQREELTRYRVAIRRWKQMARDRPTRRHILPAKTEEELSASLRAFHFEDEPPADPEELRTDFMVKSIRDGGLSQAGLEILEHGYENGFTVKELARLLGAGEPEDMEKTYENILFGRRRMEAILEAAASRRKKLEKET